MSESGGDILAPEQELRRQLTVREQVLDLLLEKVEGDRYPSSSMLDDIERLLTPWRREDYAAGPARQDPAGPVPEPVDARPAGPPLGLTSPTGPHPGPPATWAPAAATGTTRPIHDARGRPTVPNQAKLEAQEALYTAIKDQAQSNMKAALRAGEKAQLLRDLAEAYRLTAGGSVPAPALHKGNQSADNASNGRSPG